ncbi:MAG: SIR2 family protein [Bacilli bacterium]|jgi:hypothetical protein|nr:SIR2 family protein [Bacilli bacterium]MCH4277612.1 SIR2 family protein [Bacilli bacterium]
MAWSEKTNEDYFGFFKYCVFDRPEKVVVKRNSSSSFEAYSSGKSENVIAYYVVERNGITQKAINNPQYRDAKKKYFLDAKQASITVFSGKANIPTHLDISLWERKHGYAAYVYLGKPIRFLSDASFEKLQSRNKIALSELTKKGKLTLVLGAGISMGPYGIPSWNGLLKRMKRRLCKKESVRITNRLLEKIGGSPIATAQFFKDTFPDDYFDTFEEAFYANARPAIVKPEDDTLKATADLIARKMDAGKQIRVLTYNYDDILERKLKNVGCTLPSTDSDPSLAVSPFGTIIHVNGLLPVSHDKNRHNDRIVFSENDYNRIMGDRNDWRYRLQQNTFKRKECLFIGCSLSDPMQRFFLQKAKSDDARKTHYALMDSENFSKKEKSMMQTTFARLGVQIIWFNGYSEMIDYIHSL